MCLPARRPALAAAYDALANRAARLRLRDVWLEAPVQLVPDVSGGTGDDRLRGPKGLLKLGRLPRPHVEDCHLGEVTGSDVELVALSLEE